MRKGLWIFILVVIVILIGGVLFFFQKTSFLHMPNGSQKANSQTSVIQKRVLGTYTGTLPCADCSGLKTTLTLYTNSTYHLNEVYLGKSTKPFEQNGSFSIKKGTPDNPSALIYALNLGNQDNPWYFLRIDKGHLTALDANEKVISAPGMNFTLTQNASSSAQ